MDREEALDRIANRVTDAPLNLLGAYLAGANMEEADLAGANLRGANMEEADLAGANLRGAILAGADLTHADLTGADLTGADLSGTYLAGAILAGAYLADADLTGADLSGTYLADAFLAGADLTGADLKGADLAGAYLAGANLKGANLKGAYLKGAYLADADRVGEDLEEAWMEEAWMEEAYMAGAYLTEAWMALIKEAWMEEAYMASLNLEEANLTGANLAGADLSGAYLTGANLAGAYLTNADLRGVDLKGANLFRADLSDANLAGADLTGADLTGASLTGAILTGAVLAGTILAGEVDPFARLAQVLAGYEPLQDEDRQARVEKWADQFDEGVRQRVVEETAHVLENTLITETAAKKILERFITDPEMCGGGDPNWWKSSNFLQLPTDGQSQGIMRGLIDKSLQDTHGFPLTDCGSGLQRYIYLDDVMCTGAQWGHQVEGWLEQEKEKLAGDVPVHLHLIALAVHRDRQNHWKRELKKVAKRLEITLEIHVWAKFEMKLSNFWPIFEPTRFDPSPPVRKLFEKLGQTGYRVEFREDLTDPNCKVFSSEDARDLLEREFLTAGCRIKYELCRNLPPNAWPLGFDVLAGMGFGMPFITWHNCPNNAPLVLWAGAPWFPLLRRRTNPKGSDVAGVTG